MFCTIEPYDGNLSEVPIKNSVAVAPFGLFPEPVGQAVSDLCYEASNAIRNGAELIILSDVPRNSALWLLQQQASSTSE